MQDKDASVLSQRITPEEFAKATTELSAAGVTGDFALTPARLQRSMYRVMKASWDVFHRAIDAFIDLHGQDLPSMAASLSLPACLNTVWESLPPHDWATVARPDIIIAADTPFIVDVNATSQAGHFAINDMLLRSHRAPELRRFFRHAGDPCFVMGHYADLLRSCLLHNDEFIALSYFAEEDADGPNSSRFHYQTEIDELARLGLAAQIIHVEDLEIATSGVFHQNQRVGLIHRYFTPRYDDLAQMGQTRRLAEAARTDLVAVWTGLRGEIFSSKTAIALLSDEQFGDGLRPSLRASLGRVIPWTRLIEDRRTLWHDIKIDLLSWIISNQARLVMKPALQGMGEGVTIGREIPAQDWAARLDEALASEEPWVVQELLISDSQELLLIDRSGRIRAEKGPVVYGAFVLGGEFIGAICRYGRHGYSRLMINGLTGAIPAPVYWADR
jgi:hypothetical protein